MPRPDLQAAPMSTIEHRPDQHRFVVTLEGGQGEVTYRLDGDVMTILHTEVAPSLEGQGVAGRLVQAALDHARAHGLRVDPVCGYASQ